MKKFKKFASILLLICLVIFLLRWNPSSSDYDKVTANETAQQVLPGEKFIKQHMQNENGTIKTNLKQPSTPGGQDIALGNESLSESLGLWMMYAIEKQDQQLFDHSVEILTAFYWEDGWIRWKVGKDTPSVSTNALVDDLRIAEALLMAGERWGNDRYVKKAEEIRESLIKNQIKDNVLTDFYDKKANWASNHLTLSYLNGSALSKFHEKLGLNSNLYEKQFYLLKEMPVKNGFFPFSYNITTKEYLYHTEINMIDQLYIVYHRAQLGIHSPNTWNFIKSEFSKNKLIYGRYHSKTKKPSVNFESPAVYGLAIMTAIALNDGAFAKDLYYRMIREQTLRPESKYYGGYIDYNKLDTHIFDNLIPLLAERKLFNAGLLR